MCGRYVHPDEAALEREWAIVAPWWQGEFNYNVAPTATVPVIRLAEDGGLESVGARWGLIPSWWKKDTPPNSTFNARSEEAAVKPMWRGPMKSCRCLVPALGWYEWKGDEMVPGASGRKIKQPYYFSTADRVIAFAGLWSVWEPTDGNPMVTCSILTREAAPGITSIHHRMPVVLPADIHSDWLSKTASPDDVASMVAAAREDFSAHRVSTAVGNTRNHGPELTDEVSPAL